MHDRLAHGDSPKSNPSLHPWGKLPPHLQDSSRQLAGQLTERLAAAGLTLRALESRDASQHEGMTDEEWRGLVETLAQVSHTFWVNQRRSSGWTYAGGAKDLEAKTHPAMLAWIQLPFVEQEKCRAEIRALPAILHAAGLEVVRMPPPVVEAVAAAIPPVTHGHPPTAAEVVNIARALHELYLRQRTAMGETVLSNHSMRPWERLPGDLQHANADAARQLWTRLAAAGFAIVGQEHPSESVTPREFDGHIELLAELGHQYWVSERRSMGWRCGTGAKNPERKTHPSLVQWPELPEPERAKARATVLYIPTIVAAAGLKIVLPKPARFTLER